MNSIPSNIQMGDEGQTILHIIVTSKSVEEMMQKYSFNENQKEQVTELLIEGNSNNDMCRQKEYNLNSNDIYGYGTPKY